MINLHNAVCVAYPNAGVITGNDVNSLVVLDKNHNLISIDKSVISAKFIELQTQEAQKEQAVKDAKDSALAKLAKLGLTEDEVKALIG